MARHARGVANRRGPAPPGGLATYRDLAAHREFRGLWASAALDTAASTAASLALAFLVHEQTGSALLTALSMFGPSLAQVLGVSTLMSAADSVPPRRALVTVSLLVTGLLVVQATLDLPPAARLVLVFAGAFIMSIGSGVRWGLLGQVVPSGSYGLARSAMNLADGAFQIVGFAAGGLLVAVLNVQQTFLISASLAATAVAVLRLSLVKRPARRTTRVGLAATWRGNLTLLRLRELRPLLLALVLPNGLIVGCEALFVPYAGSLAGWLYAASALGMMVGDVIVGRVLSPAARLRNVTGLRVLLAVPFLLFFLQPPIALAAGLAAVAAVGYAATLAQQEQLVTLTPPELHGQTLGVESSMRMTMQGVCALLAGALADSIGPSAAIAILAAASLVISVVLTPQLARTARQATASRQTT